MTGQDHQQQPGRTWKVGALAEATGLTVRTLHNYDGIGLLPPSMRLAGGHRLYGADDVARLYRIIRLRQLGFPLSQVARYWRNRNGSSLPPSNAISPKPGTGRLWPVSSALGWPQWPQNSCSRSTRHRRSCSQPSRR